MATPIGDNVVVVDYDDDFFKAGYCIPERDPQVVLPTAVRRPGDGAETFRPIASRRVQDWDQLESLYAHAFYRQLGWVEGDEGAVLVSEPLFTSRADRERLAQTLFESFNVSGLYVAEQPALALYGLGKTSGVSVDVGYAVTDVAPVVDGAVVAAAARRTDVGKRDVAAALGGLLGETGARLSEARLDAARDAACVVDARARLRDGTCTTNTHDVLDAFDTNGTENDREPNKVSVNDIDARLPDGTMVTVRRARGRMCAEAVFFPARFAALAGDALKFGHSGTQSGRTRAKGKRTASRTRSPRPCTRARRSRGWRAWTRSRCTAGGRVRRGAAAASRRACSETWRTRSLRARGRWARARRNTCPRARGCTRLGSGARCWARWCSRRTTT